MRQIDLQRASDEAPFTRFHWIVLIWCALAIVFDGYDLAVVGIALPSIMKDMGVDATQAGFMASSALFGMMFGNVVFGGLSDRYGRRLVMCLCIAIFSLFTALAGLMRDPVSFSMMRFIAGLGIGGVMPNVIAQMTDYSPLRMRSTLITLTFSGYSVGGMLAAILGKGLIETYGWQTVFLAAAAPVVLLPLIWLQMPESLGFMLRKGQTEQLKRVLTRMNPGYVPQADDRFVLSGAAAGGAGAAEEGAGRQSAFGELFSQGRAFSTLMFWLTCFMALFMVYALNSWLTKLMAQAGYSLGSALTFVLVLNVGATVGAVCAGWVADRLHIKLVTFLMFVMAAVAITLMGHRLPTPALFLVVAIAGACTIGTQTMTCAYCSQFYPTTARSTGVGMMLGVGRVGAILAPIVIGMIVNMDLPLASNFMAIAIPAIVAACSILLVQHGRSDLVRSRMGTAMG
ncbi:MAG: MFS transporter [Burkholderiaceae bacterium]|jgi:AAHS family benzoate transporter-like MFS transporter|nr:MFS transporter [Burkholderiaceae bacterium]